MRMNLYPSTYYLPLAPSQYTIFLYVLSLTLTLVFLAIVVPRLMATMLAWQEDDFVSRAVVDRTEHDFGQISVGTELLAISI